MRSSNGSGKTIPAWIRSNPARTRKNAKPVSPSQHGRCACHPKARRRDRDLGRSADLATAHRRFREVRIFFFALREGRHCDQKEECGEGTKRNVIHIEYPGSPVSPPRMET